MNSLVIHTNKKSDILIYGTYSRFSFYVVQLSGEEENINFIMCLSWEVKTNKWRIFDMANRIRWTRPKEKPKSLIKIQLLLSFSNKNFMPIYSTYLSS